MRLWPPSDFTLFGVTIPSPFVPGVVLPGLAFAVIMLWPFIEARLTRDSAEHHLLDRPRDVPWRTAVGAGALLLFIVLTIAGGNDVMALLFRAPVTSVTNYLRIAVFVVPAIGGIVVYRVCRNLQGGSPRGLFRRRGGTRLRRTPSGGFEPD